MDYKYCGHLACSPVTFQNSTHIAVIGRSLSKQRQYLKSVLPRYDKKTVN